jgi:creatinine amidohydrolase
MDKQVVIENMSLSEVQKSVEAGNDIAIVPVGSIEAHGPHLPLICDSAQGEAWAIRIAQKLGNALVAPLIKVGVGGEISFTPPTLAEVMKDYSRFLVNKGFKTIFIVMSHGGDFASADETVAELPKELGGKAKVFAFTKHTPFCTALFRMPEKLHGISATRDGHGGHIETSQMLALRPDLVDKNNFGIAVGEMADAVVMLLANAEWKVAGMVPTAAARWKGTVGDPKDATAEMGRDYIETMADWHVKWFREWQAGQASSQ